MPQTKVWTLQEKLQTGVKAIEMEKQGNIEEYVRLTRSIPMSPFLAKFAKEHLGTDFLLKGGWNLSEAEAEYGSDWLAR
jgi:hypothetical protein